MKRRLRFWMMLFAGMAAGVACARHSTIPLTCERQDWSIGDAAAYPEAYKSMNLEWMKDVYVCTSGETVFAFPADRTPGVYAVGTGDGFDIMSTGPGHVSVMDIPYLMVSVSDQDHDGHFDYVDYSTWKAKHHYLEAHDGNIDGQMDWRTVEQADGSILHEAWVTDRWRPVVMKDGIRLRDELGKRLRTDAEGNYVLVAE